MFLLQMLNAYKTALYQSSSSSIASLQLIKEREPVGDVVHLIIASLYMFSIPVNTIAASTGFGALLVYSLIRLHMTWKSLVNILINPIMLLSIVFVGWNALSLLWTDGLENGLEHLRSMRMFLAPLLLWPIIPHWKWLLLAIVAGVFFLNIFQLIDMLQLYLLTGSIQRTSGFMGGHPPSAGLWCTASMLIIYYFLHSLRSWQFCIATIAFLFATIGLIASSGRGNIIGLAFVAIFFAVLNISKLKEDKRYTLSFAVIMMATIATIWFTPASTFLNARVNQAINGFQSFVNESDPRSSTGVRLTWWGSALRSAQLNPVSGLGLGGFAQWTEEDDGLAFYADQWPTFTKRTIKGTKHPHSMYMSTIAEGGLIGISMLLTLISCCVFYCWKYRDADRSGGIVCSLLMLWLIAGFFDSFHYSSQTLSLLTITFTIAMYFVGLMQNPSVPQSNR